ncbi:MAG: AAA family ATPase [Aigarchaeota archaeon]|nr:AAA family ATPase [Aigarchaeota archaeon]MDW8093181.1 AAA family ATPase [Nitrososphaerota archaeon]
MRKRTFELLTGIDRLDGRPDLLPVKAMYLVCGEEKSGKTTLTLQIASIATSRRFIVYWVDCGDRLNANRLRALADHWRADLTKFLVSVPRSLKQQEEMAVWLSDHASRENLIVFDDFTHLHRIEMRGDLRRDNFLFRSLAFQTALLKDAVVSRGATVIMVSDVHSVPIDGEERPVAHAITTIFSDVLISLKSINYNVKRLTVVADHERLELDVRITDGGIS